MHNLVLQSLCTKRTWAPHGDTLDRMSHISNNSYNWTFNSLSSVGAIRYGALDVGVVLGTKFMAKSISLTDGKLGKSFRKASRNSHATGMSSSHGSLAWLSTTWARKPQQPSLIKSLLTSLRSNMVVLRPLNT